MKEYIIDGAKMTSRAAAHDELARALSLPAYYGRNLDALWDCVSTMEGKIILLNADLMEEALGSYAELLEKVFVEAEDIKFVKKYGEDYDLCRIHFIET